MDRNESERRAAVRPADQPEGREAVRREQARRDKKKRPSAREQADSEARRRKNRLAEGQRHFSRSAEQSAAAEGARRDKKKRPSRREQHGWTGREAFTGMTREDWLYKWFRYTLALLPVWWLDAYVLSRFPVWGVTPCLLPAAAAAVGVLEGTAGGTGFGFGVGLVWAAAYPGGHGWRALLLAAVGLVTGAASQYALAQTLLGFLLCSAGTLAALEALRVLEGLLFQQAGLDVLLRIAVPQLLWSLCWAPLVYALFYRVFRKVGGNRLA